MGLPQGDGLKMPVKYDRRKRKWRIGSGPAMYKSRAAADRAYAAYRVVKHTDGRRGRKR